MLPDALVIAGNNALALVTLGLPWLALRRLRGAAAPARWLALLPALWLGACLVPAFYASLPARICLQTALIVFLLLGAGREALCLPRVAGFAKRARPRPGPARLGRAAALARLRHPVRRCRGRRDDHGGGQRGARHGGVFLGLAIARERAARREATAQQAGREEVERLLGGLPAVIFLRAVRPDGEARLLYRGGDVEVVTGWPAATFQGIDSLQPWIDLDAVGHAHFMDRMLREGAGTVEYRLRQPMGGSRWIRSHCRVLSRHPDGGGEVVGYLLDVTAERAAEARAMVTGRLASLGEMAAGLAHEFEQPLSIIALAAENAGAALGRNNAAGVASRLGRIGAQAHRAATVIENLRRFARGPAAGKPAEAVRLDDAVAGTLSLVGGALREAEVEVVVCLGAQPPSVLGDLVAIEQVLLNLLVNARDALVSQPGGAPRQVRIAAAAEPETGMVRLTVADTAGGIAAAVLPTVFEPFVTTKGPDRGTGLGLSICYGLLRGMGGSIAVANDRDGAVFTVLLPAAPAGAAAAG